MIQYINWCNVLFYDIHYTSTRYQFRWVQSENLYRILKLQPLIARYIVCYDYNRDVFCVYSVVENRLFPFLKKRVVFSHVLVHVRKNAAFLTPIFPFHKIIYNYLNCSVFFFFFWEGGGEAEICIIWTFPLHPHFFNFMYLSGKPVTNQTKLNRFKSLKKRIAPMPRINVYL